MSHASSAGGRLHAGATRKQLGDGEAKQRRVAYGSDVIKDELRKGAGGPAGAGPEQIGDSSEDEDEDTAPAARLHSITRYSLACMHAVLTARCDLTWVHAIDDKIVHLFVSRMIAC